MIDGLFSPMHLLIVAIIALIVLGPKRLPETGRALGKGIRELKDGLTGSFDRDEREEAARPTLAAETTSPIQPARPVEGPVRDPM